MDWESALDITPASAHREKVVQPLSIYDCWQNREGDWRPGTTEEDTLAFTVRLRPTGAGKVAVTAKVLTAKLPKEQLKVVGLMVVTDVHPPKTGLLIADENSNNIIDPMAVLGPPFFTPMLNCNDLPSCTAAAAVELLVNDEKLRSDELTEVLVVSCSGVVESRPPEVACSVMAAVPAGADATQQQLEHAQDQHQQSVSERQYQSGDRRSMGLVLAEPDRSPFGAGQGQRLQL